MDTTEKTAHAGGSPDEFGADFIARLIANDANACAHVVRRFSGMALAVARRFLRNEADAQEAVQDAFLSFFNSLETFRQGASLATWLHRIVVNAALMKRRAKMRRPETLIDELLPTYLDDGHRRDPRPAWPQSTADLVANAEARTLVRQKIEELPEEYRNVIMLRDIEQLDTGETAQLLGDTPGAVKTRLHRARQALRTLLESEFLSWDSV